MASSKYTALDPRELLSKQIIEALKFVNWAKDESKSTKANNPKSRILLELSADCYSLALRNMSDYLFMKIPKRERR